MKEYTATELSYKNGYEAGVRDLAERLCEGRVSNDPIVIAVKVEIIELLGKDERK